METTFKPLALVYYRLYYYTDCFEHHSFLRASLEYIEETGIGTSENSKRVDYDKHERLIKKLNIDICSIH